MQFRSIIFAVALLFSGSLFASVTEEETFSYTLSDGGRFSISNVNGSVTVTGGRGDNVEIIATKKADDQEDMDKIEIEISHSADEIVIETEFGKSDGWFPITTAVVRSNTRLQCRRVRCLILLTPSMAM